MKLRICVGRDVRVVSQCAEGVELEGRARLRPGRDVDIILPDADPVAPRTAIVWSWRIIRVGTDGPTFRGLCRWI